LRFFAPFARGDGLLLFWKSDVWARARLRACLLLTETAGSSPSPPQPLLSLLLSLLLPPLPLHSAQRALSPGNTYQDASV